MPPVSLHLISTFSHIGFPKIYVFTSIFSHKLFYGYLLFEKHYVLQNSRYSTYKIYKSIEGQTIINTKNIPYPSMKVNIFVYFSIIPVCAFSLIYYIKNITFLCHKYSFNT